MLSSFSYPARMWWLLMCFIIVLRLNSMLPAPVCVNAQIVVIEWNESTSGNSVDPVNNIEYSRGSFNFVARQHMWTMKRIMNDVSELRSMWNPWDWTKNVFSASKQESNSSNWQMKQEPTSTQYGKCCVGWAERRWPCPLSVSRTVEMPLKWPPRNFVYTGSQQSMAK